MQRYNIFNQVHKGLRVMLYETAKAIQLTDFSNAEESANAIEKLKLVLKLFEKHASTEDNLVFPRLTTHYPAVVDAFEKEHVEDLALTEQLNGLITTFENAGSREDKIKTGITLNRAFVHFLAFNLEHMAKEEDMLNKLFWQHYTDRELVQLTEEIVRNQPPDTLEIMSRWMMRGLNSMEIIYWLKNIKNNAPEFAFQSMIKMAEKEIDENRWQKVKEQLTEGALVD